MKYVDRFSLGIERFFEDKSQMISNIRDFSADEIVLRLAAAPYRVRFSLAHIISDGISQLIESGREVRERIPAEVERLSLIGNTLEPVSVKKLEPFFEWITDILRENEQGHVRWLAAARDAASRMDDVSGEFLVAFTSLINQRVVLKRHGDGIVMTTAEREWGRADLFFPNVCFSVSEPEFPIMGYLFCMETDAVSDNDFRIRMMMDTEFSDEPYVGRMLQDRDWLSVDFSSGKPSLELTEYDYISRLRQAGTPRSEIIEVTNSLLLSKLAMVGNGGLRPSERDMIPLAKLLHGSIGLIRETDENITSRCGELVCEALENRYAVSGIRSLLSSCDCSRLIKELDSAVDACFDDDTETALKEAKKFARVYLEQIESGTARRLLYKIEQRMIDMMPSECSGSIYYEIEKKISERIENTVSKKLADSGFIGNYPHYTRKKDDRLEYISFVLRSDNYSTKMGNITYNVVLAVGKTASGSSNKFSPLGVPIDVPNALDCVPEMNSTSMYGEIAGDYDDIRVNISVNIFKADDIFVSDELDKLSALIDIAEREFSGKGIDREYKKQRKAAARTRRLILRATLDNAHIGIVAAMLILVCYMLFAKEFISLAPAIIAALAFGAFLPFAIAVVLYFVRSNHIWRM